MALAFLTAAFAVRGAFWNAALPYGDPLDEPFHLAYADHVARTGRPPKAAELSVATRVLRPLLLLPRSDALPGEHPTWRQAAGWTESERRERWLIAFGSQPDGSDASVTPNYEAQQPPLAYFLAARWIRGMPPRTTDRTLLALRWIATLLAALSVPLVFAFFRRLFAPAGAFAATSAYVACPGLASFVGRFSNDALALPIAAGILVLLADASRGRLSRGRAVVLAALLAAGCWTKLYFLPLLAAGPLAALAAPARERLGSLRRSAAASLAAVGLILPWLARRRMETGDWLGMPSALEAVTLRIGILDRLRAAPDLLRPRFLTVLGRTFLWPGTWSAMGAPAILAVLLGAAFVALFVSGLLGSTGRRSPLRRRTWLGAASAFAFFALGYVVYATTVTAAARRVGRVPTAGPDGWYVLILLPILLTAGCLAGGRAPRRVFIGAAVLFVVVEAVLAFGVLPAVYAGRSLPNGANAPIGIWIAMAATPGDALRVLARTGLAQWGPGALGALAAAYPILLGGAAWLAREGTFPGRAALQAGVKSA